ncbi:Rne/Rng family ribonuclease [Tardiphaga sp. vice352]|uniref:Rne/Rng family ribonuclease n=1 Tax=Tardiphaga sp. vice352 TaxID=2592816 RepID=UPI001162F88C|nr:Rne/Rng family ribonuclease [Tardiphaga sp. vice352]QDM32471.1 Rne/Rng family ribonuclease [Tardiphaga sp. vice352]
MPNKMLIDATHAEETRVVVIRGNRVEEFDFETAQRKQLRGNIYLAKVTRVEPSLQAAFIEYGGNRHGFLAFSEIHPDYYQIPVADRLALIEADERAHREAEEETDNRSSRGSKRPRHRNSRRRSGGERVQSDVVAQDPSQAEQPRDPAFDAPAGEHVHAHDEGHHAGEHHEHDHDGQPHSHAHDHAEGDHSHGEPAVTGEAFGDHHHESHAAPIDAEAPVAEVPVSETSIAEAPAAATPAVEAVTSETPASETPASEIHPDQPVAETAAPETAAELAEPVAAVATEAHDHGHDDHAHEDHHDAAYAAAQNLAHADDAVHHDEHAAVEADEHDDEEDEEEEAEEDQVESVGGDDVLEEVPERAFRPRRQYKIQEVIKRRQVMLVQVVKEERGNKGAALTTYLSLAGRYAVLMPNTARGGGISRKITSAQDRSRLKEVVSDLDVPEGMGIILRTAGASRTKPEIKRDFEYLIRMWETVRDMTLKSQAPTLVYEEGSLIKRSLRDLYNKEIDEIQVAGEAGYQEARDFMHMLMPSNVRAVKLYRDGQPLFSRMGVESQLDAMFSPTVQLKSGGYIVINQTEALVSIDVNSGRSTKEHHIEDTALKTNLEAAEEVARQLRLRDLAGLIVIDFIDMDEKRNNRSVERKMSDCLRQDRARIQVGRISHFGLLEMSRQRIRASVLESSTEVCTHCGGSGHVRSVSSVALQLLRGMEEILMKGATHNMVVRTRTDVALYVLNHKRGHLRDLESSFKVTLAVIADASITGQQSFVIDRGDQVHTLEAAKGILAAQVAAFPPPLEEEPFDDEDLFEVEAEIETEETEGLVDGPADGSADDDNAAESAGSDTDADGRKRKRRRRRRGRAGETREGGPVAERDVNEAAAFASEGLVEAVGDDAEGDDEESEDVPGEARAEPVDGERRPRRRGRRGGRRRRGGPEDGVVGSIADELGPLQASEASEAVADLEGGPVPHDGSSLRPHDSTLTEAIAGQAEPAQPASFNAEPATAPPQPVATPEPEPAPEAVAQDDDKAAARRRSTVREKVSFGSSAAPVAAPVAAAPEPVAAAPEPVAAPAPVPAPEPAKPDAGTDTAPRKAGWWSRAFGNGE